MKTLVKFLAWGLLSLFLFILITNLWIILSTRDHIHPLSTLPTNDVGLVLGTSKQTRAGRPNRFFVERMNAAAELFREKKIRHLLVSGDNGSLYYNEPRDMLHALGDLEIPYQHISLDFAGFRTLDSVVRSREVFGQDSITIITQQFHCYRSLFIARHFGIKAVALSAGDEDAIGFRLAFREILARSFTVIDLYVFRSQPRFLGEKVELDIQP